MDNDITEPLLRGCILEGDECEGSVPFWVDFKYEHLPIFCYRCGKLGYSCNEYIEGRRSNRMEEVVGEKWGTWLRAPLLWQQAMRWQRQSPLESDDDREASEPTLANNPIATALLPPNIEEGVHSGDADDSDNMSADFVEGITLDVRTTMGGDPHIPPITELSSQESNPVHVIFET